MINTKLLLTALIFFLLGVVTAFNLIKFKQPPALKPAVAEQSNPINFITGVKTTQGMIYLRIDQENIYFHPFEDMDALYKSIHISKNDYPKLFQQGIANSSALEAEEYINPQTNELLIKLSNKQPDHMAFASTYVLLVNPFTGEIKEGATDYSK